ncbi:C4-dicarboxylate TRAP transporter substrate-binding protein [Hyphomicrobium sp. CS1BSMeth3]|uniref:C4-dicarboxylate TRAP transporter substrate-binding protein n=1 Tax=Hyphomicrobium sp. CS1BSMeth3 TaxID=1892844 RepID=UPI0009305C26|nr:C4-dicarboxylate TRAP transporter substrate-binding protein [Hyphomicrobium sp. CS1BSMeth3]
MAQNLKLPITLSIAAALLSGLASVDAGAQSNLAYTNYLPPSHATNRYALQPMFAALEQETKGSLKITLHPGGALVAGKGTLSAVRDGLADGGFIVSLYAQNEIPLNTALSDLAFLARDPLSVMGAINETVLLRCPDCLAEYKKYKIMYFGAYSTTPYKLMCRKPVPSLADVKSLKLRAPGNVYGRWAIRMGGVPVNIENAEAYEALQRGQIDCVLGALSWLETLSLWDTAKYVVDVPQGAYFGGAFLNLNSDSWTRLSAADKGTFLKLMPTYLAKLAVGYVTDDADVLGRSKAKGVTLSTPDKAFVDLLAAHKADEIKEATAMAKRRGAKNPEAAIQAFLDALKKWEGIVDEIGADEKKFEAALRREIYDKTKF